MSFYEESSNVIVTNKSTESTKRIMEHEFVRYYILFREWILEIRSKSDSCS